MDMLRDINEQGITIVVVTHEADISDRTDRRIVLRDGRVEADA